MASRLALALLVATASGAQAGTLTASFAAWQAAVGGYATTSNTGIADYTDGVTAIPLDDGTTLATGAVSKLSPFNGYGPFSATYTGDIFSPATGIISVTLTPAAGISAFGFEVSPGGIGSARTITVTTSSGQSISDSIVALDLATLTSATQFFGYYGGGISSITISVPAASADGFAFGNIVDVPEPATAAVLGMALLGLVRRKRG